MPQIHPWDSSRFAAGGAGGVVSVNTIRIYPEIGSASGWQWFDANTILTTHFIDGVTPEKRLVRIDTSGREIGEPLLVARTINQYGGGGGHWWATTDHGVYIDGVNRGFTIAPIVTGSNGVLAWFPWGTQGLWLLEPSSGHPVQLSSAAVEDVQIHGFGVLWREGSRIRSYNLDGFPANPQTIQAAFGWLRAFRVGAEWWLAYQVYDRTDMSVVCHPAHDASRGKILSIGGLCYRLDACAEYAVWSALNQDLPADIRVEFLAVHSMVDLAAPRPNPEPNPEPKPEPKPMPEIPNLSEIVQAVWTKYGGKDEARGAMCNEIAWRGNGNKADGPWGVSRKEGGAHAVQPRTGEKIAHDVVQYGPTDPDTGAFTGRDVFADGGPIWAEAKPHNDPKRIWLPAVAPEGDPEPKPEPEPDNKPGSQIAALKARVTEIEAKLAGFESSLAGLFDLLRGREDWEREVLARLGVLESRPVVPEFAVVVDEHADPVSTNRAAFHAHQLRIKVVPK